MATQYDKIGKTYASFKQLPLVPLEISSISARLGSVRGLNCLDLACGLGDWTRRLAHLGARSVVGVDLSKSMVDGATEALQEENDEVRARIQYLQGDGRQSDTLDLSAHGRPFDLVMGNWFFNYAADYATLTSMFRTIHDNLSPEGSFIGITPNTFCPFYEAVDDGYGIYVEAVADVDGTGKGEEWAKGWRCRLRADVGEHGIEFEMYHFMHQFYERAAKEAGMVDVMWHPVVLPDERPLPNFFDRYMLRPHMCILTARRQAS